MNTPSNKISAPRSPHGLVTPLLEPADYTEYLLRSASEILFILRAVMSAGDHISVYFNDGHNFLLTTIVDLDGEAITLDVGNNAEINEQALVADRLFCVTTHDRVRIQFLLHGVRQVQFEGRPAFRAVLPETLLRLQRREYYRLTAPIARPLKCNIPFPSADGMTSRIVDVNVVDISGGGLAVMTPPEGMPFAPEMMFPDCRVELPEVGVLVATLQVRSLFEVTLRTGAQVKRAGCQFLNLPGPMLTLVQRYILKVERERKAREAGMA